MTGEPRRRITRVVLVQAMNSTAGSHWYPWLTERLRGAGLAVVAPPMPDPFDPSAEAWQATLEASVGGVDEHTLVIAHSVGNAAALRYLGSLPDGWALGGLVNVAGFAEPQPGNDATVPFTVDLSPALDLVRESTPWRHAFIGADDPEIPRELTDHLAASLDSTTHVVDGAGHFRDEDGYTEFPALADLVLERATGDEAAQA